MLSPRREDAKNTYAIGTMTEDEIGGQIVDIAVQIHRAVGPGLLESVYEVILAHELRRKGLAVERQVSIPVEYVEKLNNAHKKQLLTYLTRIFSQSRQERQVYQL